MTGDPNDSAGSAWFTEDAPAASEDREAYLAALVRLAAVDGAVDAEERVIAEVAAGLGLEPSSVRAARRRAADRAVDTAVLVGGVRDNGLRVCLLRDAYRVAAADGHVSAAELEELGRLAGVLGVPAGVADRPPAAPSCGAPHAVLRHARDGHTEIDASEFADRIAAAPDVDELASRARDVRELGRDLVDAGVAAPKVTRAVSSLADAVARRALRLVLDGEDVAGLDFCWLSFGSEGRLEQTLCSDQDNGIVFATPPGAKVEDARARLAAIGAKVNDALAACGFSRCRGGVMAGNPRWCLTVDEWRERFRDWIERPTPESLLHATIFFDFRPLSGNGALADAMREEMVRLAPRHREFLSGMARNALFRRPPLGLFRDFAVEAGGEHAGTLDLKTGAAALFVDAARVYALAAGVGAPSTEDRMRLAAGAAGLDHHEADALVEAFHFVQVLRLRSQLDLGRAGEVPHNRIDPYALNPLERRFFRESLRLAAAIQRRMERDFAGEAPRI